MHPPPRTILLVEDDAPTRGFLADNLGADGFSVICAECARDALRLLEAKPPDLALVDIGLPDATGYELLRRVRQADGLASRLDPELPLVVLSGRADDLARVRGFERGADDFIAKPFCYPELRARIEAVLRRSSGRRGLGRLQIGALDLDPATREVRLHGVLLPLPAKEFALLRTLAGDPTRVFTKHELLRMVWGYESLGLTRTLDTHACRLRKRLQANGDRFVLTVWGVGYRLIDGPGV